MFIECITMYRHDPIALVCGKAMGCNQKTRVQKELNQQQQTTIQLELFQAKRRLLDLK